MSMSVLPDSLQVARPARLLDALPAIAWSASADTFRFTYINQAAEAILGYPAQRWLEEPNFWSEHIHPADLQVVGFCHNETLACRNHELVYRMIAADGRIVWIRDFIHVYTAAGAPVELFGVMIDITREREAEEELKESRDNFRRMVELSPDCIGVHVGGRYVYMNQAFVDLLGAKDESEIVGRDVYSIVDPAYHEEIRERLVRLHAGESVPYVRQKFRRIDGTLVDVEVAALPLRYDIRDAVQVIARDITDRIRDEHELQTREARLELLALGTHEAIWEWVPDRNELWMNNACRLLIGASDDPDEFFDLWLSRIHAEDQEGAWAVVRHTMREQSPNWWQEYRLRHDDGSERVILDRGHTATSPDGERRVIGAMLDVTSLRDAERQRAAAEAKFRGIVEQAVVAVYVMEEGRLTYINDTGAKMLGYEPRELMEMDLALLLDGKDDRPAAVFAGGPNVSRIRRKNGMLLHVAFYPNEALIDGRKIIVGTGADMTESIRAQQAMEASERRYRELVEGVSDILFTVDGQGRFVSLNRSFERSTGYRVEEWIGRPFTELFRPPSTATATQDGGTIREYELPAKNGAAVTVEVSSQPRYVDGVADGTIGMARDVTESRSIARKLEETKRMSSLGQVAASLAHEFNNVLMGIQPFVEVIAHNPTSSRVPEFLHHITRAIGRGKRASQEILRFANPQEPQVSAVDVRTWFPTFLGDLAGSLPLSIRLGSSLDPGVRLLRCDREHLEQVITNLVFNARDALQGNGTIEVNVSPSGDDRVWISVSDDGPGVAEGMEARIFEPLYTTKRSGTGLGLAIARRLMERQGGALTVENRAGGGAAFHVSVPVASDEQPVAGVVAHAAIAPPIPPVLHVEDDPSAGAGLEQLLEMEGYETTWVQTAAEAPEAARTILPQVAIIDVNLPDGDGAELAQRLRAEHENLPIVLSTGHVDIGQWDDEDRIIALMKPYELDALLDAISRATALAVTRVCSEALENRGRLAGSR
ncbi:MAG: PAS domain S-box protein [Thermoanaerobaculia bacterium]